MVLKNIQLRLLFLFIVLLGAWFRFQGLDWDGGHHLQPDERYISLVLSNLRAPSSWEEYIDPNLSSLSPYINGYGAYIYGQLPLTALTYLSRWVGMEGYDKTYLLGRFISAMLDTLSIVLIYKLGKRLWNEKTGVIGAGFYAFSPLAIQYSHFMTMESWVTFNWLLVILLLVEVFSGRRLFQESPRCTSGRLLFIQPLVLTGIIGVLLGAAGAIKASSVVVAPVVGGWVAIEGFGRSGRFGKLGILGKLGIIWVVAGLSFRFFQPTIFASASWLDWSLRQDFYQAFNFQRLAIEGRVMFPPQWQWVGTARWWFPLKNIVLWGMGPAAGGLAAVGVIWQIWRIRQIRLKWLLAAWIAAVFFWQGGKFVKNMRYFLPFLPLYALFAASAIEKFNRITSFALGYLVGGNLLVRRHPLATLGVASDLPRRQAGGSSLTRKFANFDSFSSAKLVTTIVMVTSIIFSGLWALMFTNIYRAPTTRVAASEWIYQNIPAGSKIMLEEWDDPLPLSTPGYDSGRYQSEMVQVYAPDDNKKREQIKRWTGDFDWIVLSSPRAKGSIGKLPNEFPLMSKFYRNLDNGNLGFVKTAEFTSYPKLDCSLFFAHCSLLIDDSSAEESFWVYDHPKVEIYSRKQ